MIPTKEVSGWKMTATALLTVTIFLTACSKESASPGGQQTGPGAPSDAATHSATGTVASRGGSNALPVGVSLTVITQQFAAQQALQAEAVQKLLSRLEQLESQNAERAAVAQVVQQRHATEIQAHEARAQVLQVRIAELEGRVEALQAGRLLPEIALPAEEGPTTKALEQKLLIAERQRELDAEAAEARARELPQLSIGAEGVSFRSADTNFALRLRGLLQLDGRGFIDDDEYNDSNDTFLVRRARPILEGTVFRDFNYRLEPDLGMSATRLFDAWFDYRYRPELQLKAGKFKAPVGLEHLQSDATLPFNERGLVSNFMPVRNVGVQLSGDVLGGRLSYAAGAFNVAGDGRNPDNVDFGDEKELSGRVFLQPLRQAESRWLKDLGFGVGGSYALVSSNALGLPSTTGGTLPGYVTPAGQQFFAYNPLVGPVVADGAHWRITPHAQYTVGPFGLLGEYALTRQGVYNSTTLRAADLEHRAWQVSAQWVLTGEPASFRGIIPRRAFNLHGGGWGAWQLVGRFGQLDIDDTSFQGFANPATSASGTTSWSVGMNWWLNQNLRLLTSFTHSSFEGGGAPANPVDAGTLIPPGTVTRKEENAVMVRMQLSF
ncbi:MAG: porin [Verrucomicrobiales bacterium]|nr:porin [Verrucomicrobiales bacterium]